MNKALDHVRAEETGRMKREGRAPVLKKSRWLLLRHSENLGADSTSGCAISSATTSRPSVPNLLKEAFQQLWEYSSPAWAGSSLTNGAARPCAPVSNP